MADRLAREAAHGNREFGIAGAIGIAVSPLGGLVAVLAYHGARATVALDGGQVLSYVPAGGGEVLWLSPLARLGTGKAVRGGIPVCWPWFGPHPTSTGLPAHGVVRTARWRVVETAHEASGVRVRLGWSAPEGAVPPGLPDNRLSVRLDVTLGRRLSLGLTTENGGARPVEITGALHSYFRIGDIGVTAVTGLDGARYLDKLDGMTRSQSGDVTFAGEVDRIYAASVPVAVRDPVLARRITIEATGSASTVVWTPWTEKALRLGDLGPEGHARFVCVETANAGRDQRVVAPGMTHTLGASIGAEPL